MAYIFSFVLMQSALQTAVDQRQFPISSFQGHFIIILQWIPDLRDLRGPLKFMSYLKTILKQKHCIYPNVSE
jgi:hypothetical protein